MGTKKEITTDKEKEFSEEMDDTDYKEAYAYLQKQYNLLALKYQKVIKLLNLIMDNYLNSGE